MDFTCCWQKAEISPEECPNIEEGEEDLYSSHRRRVLEKCLDCRHFSADIERLRDAGDPLVIPLSFITDDFLDMKLRLQSMDSFLNSKTREIRFLHELSTVLQTTLDLDEVLSVAMTAITAGKGFGMNRAFLLMCDREQKYLRGYLGVGPRNYEEAWQIWQEVSQADFSLKEMALHFQKNKLRSEKAKFHDILESITTPLSDRHHILNRALHGKRPILIEDAFHNPLVDYQFAQALGVDSFLVMPLISGNRRIGVLLADNFITHRAITQQDIQLMETFAFPVAFAIVRASLYEQLQEENDKLSVANRKLKEQQELIVKMEKMALVGRITSSIAHSIRNPLMMIGGFARSLLKSTSKDDPKIEDLGTIIQEAKQLEEVLEEILNYSDSLYPVKDWWDMNQLVSNVCLEIQERFEREGCRIALDLSHDLPTVFIDYKQMAFCVKTICVCALENRLPGGEMAIRSWRDGDEVGFSVTDPHGTIDHEIWDSLQTPFSQTQELGGGVGLPLCRTILEKSGHQLTLEHPPEGGIRYTIRLQHRREE